MTNATNVIELTPAKPVLPPVHVMLDIETLGMEVNAIVLSIGAVVFSTKGLLGDFYTEIAPEKYPGGVTLSTIKFWMEQEREGAHCPMDGQNDIGQALTGLVGFLSTVCENDLSRLVIWANGTDFDIPKLTYAFNSCQAVPPWSYNSVRDCRTIFKLFGDHGTKPEKVGHHNALSDAQWQAKYLVSILEGLAVETIHVEGF